MNYLNYLEHTLFTPEIYHRRYDLDLPEKEEILHWGEPSKRIALLALPWISLYRPAGTILSIGMSSGRVISQLGATFFFEEQKNWKGYTMELAKTAVAVFALAGTIFHFTIGLYITTLFDAGQGGLRTITHFYRREWNQGIEEFLQTLSSGVYLGFMATGQLEVIFFFSCLQGVLSLYQARNEFFAGKYLEGISKVGMSCVRFCQANQYQELIQKRNAFLMIQKYQDLIERSLQGRQVRHLIESPLNDLQIEEKDCGLGAYVHGYGGGLVKGANLTFHTTVVNGQEIIELNFKVNHAFRKKLDESLALFSTLHPKETSEILALTGSHVRGIHIEKESLTLGDTEIDNDWWGNGSTTNSKVVLEGLGSISICTDSNFPTLYDRVVVKMDASKTIFDLHELMSFMNLDDAIRLSSQDDLERLKLGYLFHIFCPREALLLERSEEFFSLSIGQLRDRIKALAPDMEQIFAKYYHRMKPEEVFPGKVRYRIEGLAEEVASQGALALTAAVTGASSDKELFQRVEAMLRIGMLAPEVRFENNLGASGLGGSMLTFMSGGGDCVFTQMITEQNCRDELLFSELYTSKVRMIISLDALETGTYQYYFDSLGNRIIPTEDSFFGLENYTSRSNIFEFTQELQNTPTDSWGCWEYERNEVMIKDRIDPSLFQGIVVANQTTYNQLLTHLRASGLINVDPDGRETLLNQAVDQFIRIGKIISESILS